MRFNRVLLFALTLATPLPTVHGIDRLVGGPAEAERPAGEEASTGQPLWQFETGG